MQRTRVVPLLVLALLFSLARTDAAALTLDEVLAKHYQARGGLERIKALRSLRMTGKSTIQPNIEVQLLTEWKRPSFLRIEFSIQDQSSVFVFDGHEAWAQLLYTATKTPEKLPREQSSHLYEQADLDGPLVDAQQKRYRLELLPAVQINGTAQLPVRVLQSDEIRHTVYLDATSFLEVRRVSKFTSGSGSSEIEAFSSDYRSIEGLLFAFRLESKTKGADYSQILQFDSIQLNIDLPDSRFQFAPQPAVSPLSSTAPTKPSVSTSAPTAPSPEAPASPSASGSPSPLASSPAITPSPILTPMPR